MGFGLHVGWSIEGAIGSKYKIDASYLIPHVNIASRLEAATKQYGVPLSMSEQFYFLLSQEYKLGCRKLDTVTVRGSNSPMFLYTYEYELGSGTAALPSLNISAEQNLQVIFFSLYCCFFSFLPSLLTKFSSFFFYLWDLFIFLTLILSFSL